MTYSRIAKSYSAKSTKSKSKLVRKSKKAEAAYPAHLLVDK